VAAPSKGRVTLYGTTRQDTTRHDATKYSLWVSRAPIHTSPSRTANDKESVFGNERREYFARLLADGRHECTLVFVVSCR
jgi:hypothetical protein